MNRKVIQPYLSPSPLLEPLIKLLSGGWSCIPRANTLGYRVRQTQACIPRRPQRHLTYPRVKRVNKRPGHPTRPTDKHKHRALYPPTDHAFPAQLSCHVTTCLLFFTLATFSSSSFSSVPFLVSASSSSSSGNTSTPYLPRHLSSVTLTCPPTNRFMYAPDWATRGSRPTHKYS